MSPEERGGEKRPPSLQEFDYFDDKRQPASWEELEQVRDLPDTLERQVREFRKREKRYARSTALMLVTLVVCGWFLYDFRDEMAYAFREPGPPVALGDVVDIRPTEIPVGRYVSLTGITEHRGLTQKKVRGLSAWRDEFWYFRLLGSRGVFIEVPPDSERFAFTTEVEVAGRAVDPAAESGYAAVLKHYHQRYASKRRPVLRVIQVDYKPGEGRGAFILVSVFLALLAVSNVWVLRQLIRVRRARARGPNRVAGAAAQR